MHFEILIEDISGSKIIDVLMPKIIGTVHSYTIKSYKGCGHLPKNLKGESDPAKRILLDRLPQLLGGYGKSLDPLLCAVVVVVDCDGRNPKAFKQELRAILENCNPKPTVLFRIAIEELEAWLLGSYDAILAAYPKAAKNIFSTYKQDSICGTWEFLADIIYPGGSKILKQKTYQEIGRIKSEWAEKIAPYIDIEVNLSPSFHCFRDGIRRLAG